MTTSLMCLTFSSSIFKNDCNPKCFSIVTSSDYQCIMHLSSMSIITIYIYEKGIILLDVYIVYLCHRIHDKTIFNISPRRDTNSQVHVVPPLTVFGDVVQLRTDSSFSPLHPTHYTPGLSWPEDDL